MRNIVISLITSLVLFLTVTPVLSQNVRCGSAIQLINHLTIEYGEVLVWSGESGDTLFMVFEHPNGRSWTAIAVTGSQGCHLASGGESTPLGKGT